MALSVNADGGTVVSAGRDGTVRRWTEAGGAPAQPLLRHDGEVRAVVVSADGSTVVSKSGDGTVCRWSSVAGGTQQIL